VQRIKTPARGSAWNGVALRGMADLARRSKGNVETGGMSQREPPTVAIAREVAQLRSLSIQVTPGRFCADEVSAIVVDVGYTSCKAGFAGEDTPKAVFPSVRAPSSARPAGRMRCGCAARPAFPRTPSASDSQGALTRSAP
jgi:hypothetical protein